MIQTPLRPAAPAPRAVFPSDARGRQRGFTLVEVVIALVITLFTSVGFMASIIYSSREADRNRNHVYAIQVAEMMTARVRGGTFVAMGVTPATSAYERQFAPVMVMDTDTSATKNPLKPLARLDVNRQYRCTMAQTGWGQVQSGSGTGLVCGSAPGNRVWVANEWAGHYVTIAAGRGSGQIMRITGNTANALTVTRDLSGVGSTAWAVIPDNTSLYYIDDGKTFELAITWGNSARNQAGAIEARTINRTVVIPRS